VARGTVIGADHLILEDGSVKDDDVTLSSAILRHVRSVLDGADGDEAAAAKLLGITKKELAAHLAD
jgi:hypothetical protein